MPSPRDLTARVNELNQELMLAFRQTLPNKQFQSELMLGQIGLNLLAKRLSRCCDLSERRRLQDELNHGIRIMERGIEALLASAAKPARKPASQPQPFQQTQTNWR